MSQEEIIAHVREAVETDPNKDYIQSISLFGSFLHGDVEDGSDVDLLLEPRKSMGYFKLMSIQNRISDTIGRPVELLTKGELSKYFRDNVVKEAKEIYRYDSTQ